MLGLGAIGYMLNTVSKKNSTLNESKISTNKNQQPSMNTIYNSTYTAEVDKIDRAKAKKAYDNPKTVKSLTGMRIAEDSFMHNNMQPFFGGRIKQNVDMNANKVILENYTGVGEYQQNKQETTSFFNAAKENIYGTQNKDDFYKDRIVQSKNQNNTFPIDKIIVGPGLNTTKAATGGFQQFEAQEYAKMPTVDELRVKTNPKITYEGRTIDGHKELLPGEIGIFAKNRTDKTFEQTQDMLLRTTGAVIGATSIPEYDVRNTNRLTTNSSYQGPGYNKRADSARPDVKPTDRQQLNNFGIRNAFLTTLGLGQKDDYNKKNVMVYSNERELTSVKTYEGNITSLVKSIIAPLQDLVKTSKKEEFTNSARERGNLVGPKKITVTDPNNIARMTIKETTINNDSLGNLTGPSKITVYDPNSVARTTIKETILTDTEGMTMLTGPKQLYVYNPDEIAKTTMRETLERLDYELNMATATKKPTVYDPNDKMRTTNKETTIDGDYFGVADNLEEGGGYETANYDAKNVQKQFLADKDRIGAAGQKRDQGYLTNEQYAKEVQKQFITDNDYYGGANAEHDKPMSYEEYENMRVDNRKEVLLETHEPTQTSTKYFNPDVNVSHMKQNSTETTREVQNANRLYMEPPRLKDTTITHNRQIVEEDNRLDIRILDSLTTNPYIKNMTDANF